MDNEARTGKTRRSRQPKEEADLTPEPDGDGAERSAQPGPEEPRQTAESATSSAEATDESEALFPVVGIGVSAGGLVAIEQFLTSMPQEAANKLALVLVQHLDPEHKSLLTELVRQYTRMPVHEVVDGMVLKRGNAYVIPPNKDMTVVNGQLHLKEPNNPRGLRLPIDHFFRSLAQERRDRGVAVILSGTGSDGTLGLKAVKEAGGLVMVQQPDTAQYDGMPRSAIGTDLADYVLPPERMAERLIDHLQRSFERTPARSRYDQRASPDVPEEPLQRVFALLRSHTGHDFSCDKRNTIVRRIERRMAVHQLDSLDAYARHLVQAPAEIAILFRELLIGVTSFFRDPEVFAAIDERVIPAIFAAKRTGESVRVWVPGCSTGEEAYSIAMVLQEFLARTRVDVGMQIFATDIDAEALDQARGAVYPDSIAADVSPERLARFFLLEGNTYRIKKSVRDMVVFANQNVAEDAPFSRMDLISCRNLLIYMNTELQRRVMPLFHYALNPTGYLVLGTSETVGEFTDLFTTVDRRWKIFMRKPGGLHRTVLDFSRTGISAETGIRRTTRDLRQEVRKDLRQALEQSLLSQHTPAAVVVNSDGEVSYIHGRTGYYLEPSEGEASLNVLRMARQGLRLQLRAALRKAVTTQAKVVVPRLQVRTNGTSEIINLIVRPMLETMSAGALYLIVFEPALGADVTGTNTQEPPAGDKDERISVLERELRAKEEYLQATIEELETSNEELTSTNEELQSANEELQSTNEELETSKEELQSVNEELMTVNAELQKKIEELSRLNNDLSNLLAGTGIGTVFVDHTLRIQRFTPAATEIINLIQTDIGRPVAHIASNLMGYTDLIADVTSVLDTLVTKEREVQVRNGRWYLMRLQPYRTLDNVIEGAVLTFVDITEQKNIKAALDESRRIRVETMFDPGLVLNAEGKVLDCNQDAAVLLGYDEAELKSLRLSSLASGETYAKVWDALVDAERGSTPSLTVPLLMKGGGTTRVDVRLRKMDGADDPWILMVFRPADAA